jgi:glycosyltransferase involved in cell wall biosynthesis
MARIYIDAWCVKSETSGMGRYGRGLVPALVAAAPQHEFIVLRPAGQRDRTPLVPSAAASAREVFVHRPNADWTTLFTRPVLERAFRRFGRADLYHSLFHLLPLGLRHGRTAPRRIAVSLHDFIWLDRDARAEPRRLEAEWLKRFGSVAIPHALRSADHVICGSDATSNRAARWVPADRRTTIHYGLEEGWFRDIERPDASPPYIAAFSVGKAYKNIGCLIRAMTRVRAQRPDVRLVLIGGNRVAGADVRASHLTDHVIVRDQLTDDELRHVISGARLFVVPSLAEGFGLPALEAMALGTPLVASNIDALREVSGGAALLFDPSDPAQLASVILRALDDDVLRRDLSAKGRARAAQFTWSRAAAQTLSVYERLLENR